jgi:hypothetical protein
VNLIDRLTDVFGLGRGRRHFHNRLMRYFAGDLDRVERRAFREEIARSTVRRRVFEAEYDRRTRRFGLLALGAPDPELASCFSILTLESYVQGRLPDEDRTLVESHASCPLCGLQIRALREEEGRGLTWGERFAELQGRALGWLMRPTVLGAMATAAVLLAVSPRLFLEAPKMRGAAPVASEYRLVDEGARLALRWVTSDGLRQTFDADTTRVAEDARLEVVGTNDDIDAPRYFALFSFDEVDQLTWHIPAWEGDLGPRMMELEPGAEEITFLEAVPSLTPGRHRLVLAWSARPISLERLRAEVELAPHPDDDLAALNQILERLTGRPNPAESWEIVVP